MINLIFRQVGSHPVPTQAQNVSIQTPVEYNSDLISDTCRQERNDSNIPGHNHMPGTWHQISSLLVSEVENNPSADILKTSSTRNQKAEKTGV